MDVRIFMSSLYDWGEVEVRLIVIVAPILSRFRIYKVSRLQVTKQKTIFVRDLYIWREVEVRLIVIITPILMSLWVSQMLSPCACNVHWNSPMPCTNPHTALQ